MKNPAFHLQGWVIEVAPPGGAFIEDGGVQRTFPSSTILAHLRLLCIVSELGIYWDGRED